MSSRRGKRKGTNYQSTTPSLSLRDMMAMDTISTPISTQKNSMEQVKKTSNKTKQNKSAMSTLTPSSTKNKRHVTPSNSNLTIQICDEETLHQPSNKSSQQQSTRTSASSASFASRSSSKSPVITLSSSETLSAKRKRPEEFDDSLAKYLKFNQSTLEKVLEEQQKQRIIIEALKDEIFEEHGLLQKILSSISSLTEQQQSEKPKQCLKRKDTKNMWWDVPMTKACHQLFQVNKIPLDTDLEQAFKSQIQAHYPKKIQELDDSSEWIKLWNAVHSIMLEYFRNHKSSYVRKIKDAIYILPYTIEAILQKVFTEEELQNKDNVKFGVTVAWMFLDPTYDQVEISSSKVQERMNQWDSNKIGEFTDSGDQESGAGEVIN
ncbi:unnamed protein product [Rhizophagus irregularis]|nr:unnamed protein product [Rhizophagus irregularis]